MKEKNTISTFASGEATGLHRNTYRIFCFLAGALSPAFGVIYNFTNPDALDPLWARFALAFPMLLLLSLSYMSGWVKENFIRLVHGLFYLLTAYFVGITAVNSFSPNYALGALFAMTGFGVAFSLGLRDLRPLALYLCSAVVMCVVAVWLPLNDEVSPVIMSISAVSTALVIYVAARSKVYAEKTTAATERRYQTLLDSANDAILIADAEDDLLLEANRKALNLLGRSLDEIRRMRPKELFPADKREHYGQLFQEHVYDDQPVSEDIFLAKRSGERVPVDISASVTEVGGKQLIQAIFRDATERQRYEQQLIEAKERAEELLQLKSSFLNNMSHELRTPLTSILGYAEVLVEETEDPKSEFAEHIASSAERLQGTLDSVLDLAQLESGKTTLKLEPMELADEVTSSVELLEPLADEKGLALETLVSAPSTRVEADDSFIHRIVNNLVGNAIKFTDEGSVVVEVGRRQSKVFLRVTDTGVGIDPAFKEHLFDEFRQESTGLKRTHEGNGLGLAITGRLVYLLEGTIEVESEKGVGSTFTVWLPHAPSGEDPAPVPSNGELSENGHDRMAQFLEEAGANPNGDKRCVLVLEDNASTRKLIDYRLSPFCTVKKASTPEEALRLARNSSFDVLLLDIQLSADMNGIEVLQALRSMPAYQNVPAVALTAHALPADRERFLKAGFNLHLPKPFTTEQLSSALDEVMVWPTAPRAIS